METVGAKVGPDEDNLDIIPFRDSSAAMTAPVPLFTGDKETEFPSDYGTNGFVVVKQEPTITNDYSCNLCKIGNI